MKDLISEWLQGRLNLCGGADFIHQCCCEVTDVIMLVNWQPSFGTTVSVCCTDLSFPQEQTEGISFGCYPYYARASLKAPLCSLLLCQNGCFTCNAGKRAQCCCHLLFLYFSVFFSDIPWSYFLLSFNLHSIFHWISQEVPLWQLSWKTHGLLHVTE